MFKSWATTDFLEKSAHVSLKVATNVSFRGTRTSVFEATILNQKQRIATEVILVFEMILEGLYLLQVYIFW